MGWKKNFQTKIRFEISAKETKYQGFKIVVMSIFKK